MSSSLFGSSIFATAHKTRLKVQEILRNVDSAAVIIGQSLEGDLQAIAGTPGLNIDFLQPNIDTFHVKCLLDTLDLADEAHAYGLHLPRKRLGNLVNQLGIPPEYLNANNGAKGVHNASNDAAYTMLAMLRMIDICGGLTPENAKRTSAANPSSLWSRKARHGDRRRERQITNEDPRRKLETVQSPSWTEVFTQWAGNMWKSLTWQT